MLPIVFISSPHEYLQQLLIHNAFCILLKIVVKSRFSRIHNRILRCPLPCTMCSPNSTYNHRVNIEQEAIFVLRKRCFDNLLQILHSFLRSLARQKDASDFRFGVLYVIIYNMLNHFVHEALDIKS
jgi:hypothetical protein